MEVSCPQLTLATVSGSNHKDRPPRGVVDGDASIFAGRSTTGCARPPSCLFFFVRNRPQIRDLAVLAIAGEIHDRKPRAKAAPVTLSATEVVAGRRVFYASSFLHVRALSFLRRATATRTGTPPAPRITAKVVAVHPITTSRAMNKTNHRCPRRDSLTRQRRRHHSPSRVFFLRCQAFPATSSPVSRTYWPWVAKPEMDEASCSGERS
ncbi:uncharacterized protein LOC111241027 isoform X2 [Vigna radiata var. radiata]|uniref:Uncharacterized protein LOC111241027 isoform X2 n=1 Tax=Vigna radiata var. radiata TaxID=3916 RepID=A0A3Q0ES87_VIGRR|nr:uncharacterized protein LOC111241027 isoform X2 [Vigna radiata var. radiata]